MGGPRRLLKRAAIGSGAGAAVLVALAMAVIAWPSAKPADATRESGGREPVPAGKDVRIWTVDAPGPTHGALASDEWTSDAPAFQARLAHAGLVAPAPSAPPPPPHAAEQAKATPAPAQQAALAATPALALTQASAKDDSKICRNPPVPLDVAKTAAAPPLRLSYQPELGGKTMDIAPAGPPPEQEQRIRLSALLAEALQ